MAVSVFEMFKVGVGPSSSHTVGPMLAAARFAKALEAGPHVDGTHRIRVSLFGSLGATGRGHQTDRAVLLGLEGVTPERADPQSFSARLDRIHAQKAIQLPGGGRVTCDPERDLLFKPDEILPQHPNGIRFEALDEREAVLFGDTFFSVGGGFVLSRDEWEGRDPTEESSDRRLPHPFLTAAELLRHCQANGASVSDIALANETAGGTTREEVFGRLWGLWEVMRDSVHNGIRSEGMLPGPLGLRRRAPSLYRTLQTRAEAADKADPLVALDWIDLYAIAVGEENASGGRIVTAPTNGAAGIIPAILFYGTEFLGEFDRNDIARFLLTAAAIGSLYKHRASLSAAEVGCQGEIGVACSMAAGALAERRGGTPEQVQNAAEIAMEHNLGLTCDPIGGLVQIPCIERNAMGAVKAINAARMALRRDRPQYVSLDQVIRTMRETGRDMSNKYKETSKGGLAVNVSEC